MGRLGQGGKWGERARCGEGGGKRRAQEGCQIEQRRQKRKTKGNKKREYGEMDNKKDRNKETRTIGQKIKGIKKKTRIGNGFERGRSEGGRRRNATD